ncbi:right-handed parallel beta-helix repeat-containing protein [Candidatus Bathyarchaeota archaeon]|nr:right-handed parallel beta-helix repeat-containing protein [Candidatus Bathyarchaeota archaeon]
MRRGFGLFLILSVFLFSLYDLRQGSTLVLRAAGNYPVSNVDTGLGYGTIQFAINAPETLNGHTIVVGHGIYYERVVVNKSISLIGDSQETVIVDGNGTGSVIKVTANNARIGRFTVRNGSNGIEVAGSNNALVTENVVVNTTNWAIYASYSTNCTIRNNIAANNTYSGILVTNSMDFAVSDNSAYGNGGYGINANSSRNGLIEHNDAFANYYDGIGLSSVSVNCTIAGNNVFNNSIYGIWVDSDCAGNTIYVNNLVRNVIQALAGNLTNNWDSGFEGNYWSNYEGADMNNDGIGDTPYSVTGGSIDNHPLMGELYHFTAFRGHQMDFITNSTIEDFVSFNSICTVRIHISDKISNQTSGFCRVRLPHSLMIQPYNVSTDIAEVTFANYNLRDDGSSRWIYFTYAHQTREVLIRGTPVTANLSPIIEILSPQNETYSSSSVPLNFTISETTSWIGYCLDGKSNTTINGNATLSDLPDGTHDLVIYIHDSYGNPEASARIYFAVSAQQVWFLFLEILAGVLVALVVGAVLIMRLRRPRPKRPIRKAKRRI